MEELIRLIAIPLLFKMSFSSHLSVQLEYIFTPHKRNYNNCAYAKISDQTSVLLSMWDTQSRAMRALLFTGPTNKNILFARWQRIQWEGGQWRSAWHTLMGDMKQGGRESEGDRCRKSLRHGWMGLVETAGWAEKLWNLKQQRQSFSLRMAEEGLVDSAVFVGLSTLVLLVLK